MRAALSTWSPRSPPTLLRTAAKRFRNSEVGSGLVEVNFISLDNPPGKTQLPFPFVGHHADQCASRYWRHRHQRQARREVHWLIGNIKSTLFLFASLERMNRFYFRGQISCDDSLHLKFHYISYYLSFLSTAS